jgi:copper chaperone NosL
MTDATVSPHKTDRISTTWIPGPMLHTTRRVIVAALSIAAVVLLLASLKFPYWRVTLKAPQYPQGLHVSIFLNKVEGDTSEVNLLNHYIGMKKLEMAAKFERNIAIYGLAFISLFTLLFVFSGRKSMSLFALPALFFPIVFIADLFFWLYTFGHRLDPHAPIKFTPFTPRLIGEGIIGQFATVGAIGLGFYLVIASFILVLGSLILRFTVCNACPYKERCSLVCPHLFLWPPQQHRQESP